jgi:HD-GYP domain-containing protein (c-di-GMP phosphodiesterase class II)
MSEPETEQRELTVDETAASLIEELVAALINSRIYQREHPRVQESMEAVLGFLTDLETKIPEDTVRIVLADNLLIFQEHPLIGPSLSASRLIAALDAWGAGGIDLSPKATLLELNEFFEKLVTKPREEEDFETLNEHLAAIQCTAVALLAPYAENPDDGGGTGCAIVVPVQFYQRIIDVLQDVTVTTCLGGTIQFDPVRDQAEEVLDRLESDEAPMMNLARQDQYDAFTFGHSVRVAVLSLNFGRALTDDRRLLIALGTAALLHDVGKSLIPFEILHSHRTLTQDERREMGKHPELGAELLLDHHESDPLAISAAFGHHMPVGARGYPQTIHEHHNSMMTEIIKICDVYEALTAARPYKRPMTPSRAYRVMISMEKHFDRKLLRRFIEVNGVYPSGQLVELETGESARVLGQTGELLCPVVRVVTDRHGNEIDSQDQSVIDLSAPAELPRCIHAPVLNDRFLKAG